MVIQWSIGSISSIAAMGSGFDGADGAAGIAAAGGDVAAAGGIAIGVVAGPGVGVAAGWCPSCWAVAVVAIRIRPRNVTAIDLMMAPISMLSWASTTRVRVQRRVKPEVGG